MTIASLQNQLSERETALATVQQSKEKSGARIAELDTERRGLVVAARTGEQAAKARVAAIDAEIEPLRREQSDDEAAAAAISGELEQLRAKIASAKKEENRESMENMVINFAASMRTRRERIEKLIRSIQSEGASIHSETERVRIALMAFGVPQQNLTPLASNRSKLLQMVERIADASVNPASRDPQLPSTLESCFSHGFLQDLPLLVRER